MGYIMGRVTWVLLAIPVLAQEPFTGAPVERAGGPGETVAFTYAVQAGTFVSVSARQLEGDITLTVLGPDGAKIAERDVVSALGTESVPWVAPLSGSARIEIRNGTSAPARFRVEAASRTPTEEDRHRHTAMAETMAAAKLVKERTKESLSLAVTRFQTAVSDLL